MAKRIEVNYNPVNVKQLGEKEARRIYAELRKTANKRMKRLHEQGFGNYNLANVYFPQTRDLFDKASVEYAILDVSSYLRDPRTTLKQLRKIEEKTAEALKESGYSIPKEKLGDFGNYMDAMRDRYKNRLLPPSDLIAQVWEQAERKGMSGKTLMRNFNKWLDDRDKLEKTLSVLEETNLPKGRKRLSSTELNRLLGV